MNNLKSFFFVTTILLSISCNVSAKSDKKNDADADKNKGEVIALDTDGFLEKIFDYENNDEWVYRGDKPCLIDFYADWCPPCRKIAPVLERLAEEYKDDIVIYKINTDKESALTASIGIKNLPSLLFIPMKGKPQMAQGALPEETFKEIIDTVLLEKKKERKD